MVNPKKVEEKLPNLLVDGSTSNPVNWQQLLKKDYRIKKYKEREPHKYQADLEGVLTQLAKLNSNAERSFMDHKFSRR
jgi:hypothetical protein